LASEHEKISSFAHSVGFNSDDAFRRAFERRFGVSPSTYRGRFAGVASKEYQNETIPAA
jgi:AraC-like DNA-binding protein